MSMYRNCTCFLWSVSRRLSYSLGLTRNIKQRLSEVNVTQDGLAERISSYLISSRADKTTEKYKASFNKFKSFCADRGYQSLPANPIHVTIYFSHLLDQNVSYE